MNLYAVSSFITCFASLFLGVFVFLKNRRAILNRTWLFLTLSIAVYSFGFPLGAFAKNEAQALFWIRFLNIGAILIPVFFLHFVFALIEIHRKKRNLLLVAYAFCFIILSTDFTRLFIKDIVPKPPFDYYLVPGIAYYFFVIMFITYVIYAHYELIKAYISSSAIKRNQLKYSLIASTIGFIGGSTAFLPIKTNLSPIGNHFVWLYALIASYAIVKHRAMDINVIIKKGTVYAILISLIFIPCLLIIVFAQKFFFGSINYLLSSIILVSFVLATLVFIRLKPVTERAIEQILFRGRYDYKETLSELSRAMISILDKENLLQTIINTITEAMGVEKASILLIDEEKGWYDLQSYTGFVKVNEESFRLVLHDPFILWLRKNKKIIVKEELERDSDKQTLQALVKRLSDMESEVCIPLLTRKKLIGICNLGNKRKGHMFSHEDLALLETLGNQAAIAVENATLYENLKKSEGNIRRNERLVALGTLTAGLAHEIRNPLVAIKTFVQLLPERLDDAEFMDHFLKVTSDEVDRICVLVTELLEFSRPSERNFQSEDINEIAEKMFLLVENEARKKGIVIKKNYATGLPFVLIDKEQIKQVLLNLFLNAIEATSRNGIITFKTRLINKSNSKNYVQIEIGDNGDGISKDDLEHIFTPFFTTKYNGSGLGLSISYKIIQDHSGFIEVESKLGKGSTFYVDLPLGLDRGSVSNGINRGVVNRREGVRG